MQAYTPAFRRWFGNSVVVDREGNPLVVYHGAPDVRGFFGADGSESRGFRRSPHRGNAFFATDDYRTAESYVDPHRAWDYQNAEPGVIPLYLSLQHPLIVDGRFRHWRGTEATIEQAHLDGHDGVVILNTIDHHSSLRGAPPRRSDASTVYVFFSPTQAKVALTGPMQARAPNNWRRFEGVLDFTRPNDGTFDADDDNLRSNRSVTRPQALRQNGAPRFIERLYDAEQVGALEDYFPETAAGELQPRPHEQVFWAEGIGYVGDTDGRMVPIQADNLEPMPENTFDAKKFSTLVGAILGGEEPIVHPGYADISLQHGELVAQVRDGNHRAFASIVAGAPYTWVLLSDNVEQNLREHPKETDRLYRAIRAAQRAAGAPVYTRPQAPRVRGKALEALHTAVLRRQALEVEIEAIQCDWLRRYGPAPSGFSLDEQLRRPEVFFRLMFNELRKQHGRGWLNDLLDSPEGERLRSADQERIALCSQIRDLIESAGGHPYDEYDPTTRKLVRRR